MPRTGIGGASGAVDELAAQGQHLGAVRVVRTVTPGIESIGEAWIAARETDDAGRGASEQLGHIGRAVGALVAAAQTYVLGHGPVDQTLVSPDFARRVEV